MVKIPNYDTHVETEFDKIVKEYIGNLNKSEFHKIVKYYIGCKLCQNNILF